ncbi:TrkA family potassium uptake protein [Actinobacteria bacterium YIM 96077]|uniref:TrkA family potassium uptake protein n=1 Tax=Phytoactinopolyspora halophila TaxID=1981511 RepID=A0A329R0J8_9ACTN|nr:TrkA family potassium uptake protein [Actinobacteria bacterium YIM 96077]RAW17519.1 TrkA family potassium uptake protein [Phytoactinopolyspora halophila]
MVVCGLGRFGKSLALELMKEDTEVLGIDADADRVQSVSGRLTHAVVADTTKEEALRQLSVHEYSRAVVGIGSDIESSILTASVLVEMGVPNIWAKAISHSHARILKQVGVHHVTRPEHDMGARVAHLVRGRMIDYIEFDDGFSMVKTTPPAHIVGLRLSDSKVRQEYGITVVAIKRPGEGFTYATPDTIIRPGDTVIVSGLVRDTERFSEAS